MTEDAPHEESIGPYRLLSRLGDGRGGHRAADRSGRDVAIRRLDGAAGGHRPDIAAMRGVLSPYVADVLDGDPGAYVVTRFVPGRPLEEHVAGHGPLRGAALRLLALGLAKGLAAIHRAGLAHGGLAPGSVLVVDGAPVLVDFGLAAATEADDVYAWAATVTFAATAPGGGDVPAPLVPLLRAATAADAAVRPSAAELAEAVEALDLGPAPAPASAPAAPVPEPRPAAADPAAPPPAAVAVPRPELEMARGWARLLTILVAVIAVSVTVLMPVAGLALSFLATGLLRLAAPAPLRGRLLALGTTALSLPYAGAVAVAVPLAITALAAVDVVVEPLGAAALGAGAGTAVLWLAPGLGGPRRLLEEAFLRAARVPHRIAAAGVVLGLLAFAAAGAALSLTPSFAPMYGLQSSLENSLGRLQSYL
ncbi:hypothetical protein [Actinomadura parmotrematis]|uniref:Protein kinase domain-containing protein n=1 Tax=Actinomadura parmotrematis TaxID=2864039 RepID=A0ABS7FVL9_9ACTN|nr:hypothetical protein [Actinomadura parmotrematis]MBW8484477.1 hypothetical protein [Actinomadura parmotrematis]